MNQIFCKKIKALGFEQKIDTLFEKQINDALFATSTTWLIFAYFEHNKYYFSTNSDLVETFSAPDIDLDFMLTEINTKIKNYGCYLKDFKIIKEINLINIEQDLNNFISAVYCVDEMYKNLY